MKKTLLPLLFIIFFLSLNLLISQNLQEKVTVHKLKNGLTVIFAERHEAPVFSGIYGFKVGAVDEIPGITGVAHLFEHMAFKGTHKIGTSDFEKEKPIMDEINKIGREMSLELEKGETADKEKIKKLKEEFNKLDKEQKKYIVKDEIWNIYNDAGGVGLNASTGQDVTQYYINLPVNRFELYCLMESERMKNGVLREFYTERSVIQEERKQTTDAVPNRQISELFNAAAFMAHPYGHPVVGWASDINSVTLEEAYDFKKRYYTPDNCVIVIVGDIYPKKAIPLIEKYFSDFTSKEVRPYLRTIEPKQIGERRIKLEANAEPILMIGFHKPCFPNKDDATMNIISGILATGRSSRLFSELIKEKQLAISIRVSSGSPGGRYDNLFTISATPRYPNTNADLEKAIIEQIEKLKSEPVKEEELQKIKNNIEADFIRSMKTNQGLGVTLMRYQLLYGDWTLYLKSREVLKSITPQEIMECAKKYFTAENRTVAYLNKKSK